MSPVADPGLCPQNHRCPLIDSCPVEAITQEGFSLPQFDPDLCIECGRCVALCGKGAVHWVEETR
ncbi:MAG TPA: 4Fe-4S binding protein [Candidatus Alistipes stercoravium]|nr:4Fe-4S binding protein [Candidatus Alistipes stercoravium]